MPSCIVPGAESRCELKVLGSRFIATVAPAHSVLEATRFIARVRQQFADADHNVPAYVVGHGATVIAHCHDDGEPSGTAGRPALAALLGSGFGDTAVVVTRYFGGRKLGSGGLVRAYTDAVRAALAVTPRHEKVLVHLVLVAVPYHLFEPVRRALQSVDATLVTEDFGADARITAEVRAGGLATLESALQELSAGRVSAQVVARDQTRVVPLSSDGSRCRG